MRHVPKTHNLLDHSCSFSTDSILVLLSEASNAYFFSPEMLLARSVCKSQCGPRQCREGDIPAAALLAVLRAFAARS